MWVLWWFVVGGLRFVFCLVVVVGGCLAQLLLGFRFLGCRLFFGLFAGSVLVVQVATT